MAEEVKKAEEAKVEKAGEKRNRVAEFILTEHKFENYLLLFLGIFAIELGAILLTNFLTINALLLTPDSLRIYAPAKGIYLTIEWQRIADFSVFRTYGQKFIRIELHDPDRAIDEEKNRIAKGLMRWQMKYFGSPYAITASTVDIGTAELEKILREYLQASREKSAAN